jgi:hypothetical protein
MKKLDGGDLFSTFWFKREEPRTRRFPLFHVFSLPPSSRLIRPGFVWRNWRKPCSYQWGPKCRLVSHPLGRNVRYWITFSCLEMSIHATLRAYRNWRMASSRVGKKRLSTTRKTPAWPADILVTRGMHGTSLTIQSDGSLEHGNLRWSMSCWRYWTMSSHVRTHLENRTHQQLT